MNALLLFDFLWDVPEFDLLAFSGFNSADSRTIVVLD